MRALLFLTTAFVALTLWASQARAQENERDLERNQKVQAAPDLASKEITEKDAGIEQYRSPVSVLTEHFLGSASRPVRFDWRRSPVMFSLSGSELLERNNFGSFRLGVNVRKAFGSIITEAGINYALSLETSSSRIIALTPYRQAGRPSRFEIDINAGYPLLEGVVTPLPKIIPPAQMVLSALGGFRYLVYPGSFQNRSFQDVATSLVFPQLTEDEIIEIEQSVPGGMRLDRARFNALAGLSLDVYFQPGVYISPRALVALPLLNGVTGSELGLWWEMGITIGYAL